MKEAIKMALEALDNLMYWDNGKSDYDEARKAIKALEEALAKQEQGEPVVGTKTWFEDGKVVTQNLYYSDFYTTPQQRTWVHLTNQEHDEIAIECGCLSADWVFYGAAVERKVREKNS